MRASEYKNSDDKPHRQRCGVCYADFPAGSLSRVMVGDNWVGCLCRGCVPAKREALASELAFPYHVDGKGVIDTGELALLDDRRATFLKSKQQSTGYELGEAYELPNDES